MSPIFPEKLKGEKQMSQYDYFRFSKWVKSPTELKEWAEWFQARGIPWCIIRVGLFSLWRKGAESATSFRGGNDEGIWGYIVDSWGWKEG